MQLSLQFLKMALGEWKPSVKGMPRNNKNSLKLQNGAVVIKNYALDLKLKLVTHGWFSWMLWIVIVQVFENKVPSSMSCYSSKTPWRRVVTTCDLQRPVARPHDVSIGYRWSATSRCMISYMLLLLAPIISLNLK